LILAPKSFDRRAKVWNTETDESSTAVGFRADTCSTSARRTVQELPEIGNSTAILANTATGSVNSSLSKAFSRYSQDIAPARGTSAGGKITLLPGQAPAEDFSTLAHEVAHELMHRDERRTSTSKRSREDRSRGRGIRRLPGNRT